MNRLRRIKPSPSMVVASLALLVALAGTSVAAVNIVIPRNSVGLAQLKPNSVNSSKVINGSLMRADFRAGQIPAGPRGPQGLKGDKGDTGATGATGPTGVAAPGYVAEVLSATSSATSTTSSTSFTNVPNGASVNVTVPTGETDKLAVFFSGESACNGGSSLQRCLLRVLVDNNEINPVGGSAVFDNNDLGVRATSCSSPSPCTSSSTISSSFKSKSGSDAASHGFVRISGNLSAGTHTVQVQYASTNSGTTFQLNDWALLVQRIKVS